MWFVEDRVVIGVAAQHHHFVRLVAHGGARLGQTRRDEGILLSADKKARLSLLVELQVQVLGNAACRISGEKVDLRKLGECTDRAEQVALGALLSKVGCE